MINLPLNELQSDLAASVRETTQKEFPIEDAVKAAHMGLERVADSKWGKLAELGTFGISLDEDLGGFGLGSPEEFVVFYELGRALVPGPLVGTALAARYAAQAGHNDLASALAGGERRAGMVVGDKVVDAAAGDLAVSVDAKGITVSEVTSIDFVAPTDLMSTVGTAKLSEVFRVDDDTATLRARLLVGAYASGVSESIWTLSADYVKTREQFGKPIGTFQAVKHRVSEMMIRGYPPKVELAVGSVMIDNGMGRREIASGHALAVEAAVTNAGENIQNFGGIGFTAEAKPGAYLKRALTYRSLMGSISQHIDELLNAPESLVE